MTKRLRKGCYNVGEVSYLDKVVSTGFSFAFADKKRIIRKWIKVIWPGRTFIAGQIHRRLANFEEIIAVTGSCGKSSTAGMITSMMKTLGPTHAGLHYNAYPSYIKDLGRAQWGKRFWIQELHGGEPGAITRAVKFIRPTVSVVTNVKTDHIKNFSSDDELAAEKGKLVACLPQDGLAVLNADDQRVMAMASRCSCRVITFGQGETANIRALEWSEGLPNRLTVTVTDGTDTIEIHTKFAGSRWLTSVLAAMACGRGLGMSLEDCARVIEASEPRACRDSILELPDGTIIVLDSYKAPIWTLPSSFDIVKKARVPKKTIVIGTISDYRGSSSPKYRKIATAALDIADQVIFYGKQSARITRLLPDHPGRLHAIEEIRTLKDFLETHATPGELIYIKGSGADHLERIGHDRTGPVRCWRDYCGDNKTCNLCDRL